jgi:hypothetical protein
MTLSSTSAALRRETTDTGVTQLVFERTKLTGPVARWQTEETQQHWVVPVHPRRSERQRAMLTKTICLKVLAGAEGERPQRRRKGAAWRSAVPAAAAGSTQSG